MHVEPLEPISAADQQARVARVDAIARGMGFVGTVAYRHVATSSGGAQYGMGPTVDQDVLIVYAEAFRRDAVRDDFSLEAIIAHERGHQLIYRHDRLRRNAPREMSSVTEEVLASLLGSLVVSRVRDREDLVAKAIVELLDRGLSLTDASRRIQELLMYLEEIL